MRKLILAISAFVLTSNISNATNLLSISGDPCDNGNAYEIIVSSLVNDKSYILTINDEYEYNKYGICIVVGLGNGTSNIASIYLDGDQKKHGAEDYQEVIIGKYVRAINAKAFAGFTSLESITLNCEQVPSLDENAFSSVNLDNVIVNVPDNLYWGYKESTWGTLFKNITSPNPPTQPTKISDVKEMNFKVVGQTIITDGKYAEVYSITGACIYKGTEQSITLPQKGIYIIKYNNVAKTIKIQ